MWPVRGVIKKKPRDFIHKNYLGVLKKKNKKYLRLGYLILVL